MAIKRAFSFLSFLILAFCTAAAAEERLRLSTTTSTAETGLLGALLPAFEKKYGCRVDVIAVGSGKALNMGEAGVVDVVLVHARKLEDQFVANGFGVNRHDVMHNDFVLIGPADDPAGVAGARNASEAMQRIATHRVLFFSRNDQSGTHQKEQELWQTAGIIPDYRWYVETGEAMREVIQLATDRGGYTLADRGTYLQMQKTGKTDLEILFQGDQALFNPYGVIVVNPKIHRSVNYGLAMKFVKFLTGSDGQGIIAGFRVHGEPVFFVTR